MIQIKYSITVYFLCLFKLILSLIITDRFLLLVSPLFVVVLLLFERQDSFNTPTLFVKGLAIFLTSKILKRNVRYLKLLAVS